ncbi:unnamed protein product [Pedinophyceae sp. YPF-701]|nr:unnamed protein product [Pedinophyceae sp. YPF-701]
MARFAAAAIAPLWVFVLAAALLIARAESDISAFARSLQTQLTDVTLSPPSPVVGDAHGTDVALSGDGLVAVVGAPLRDGNATAAAGQSGAPEACVPGSLCNTGQAAVFLKSNGTWSLASLLNETVDLTARGFTRGHFGASVAVSSDGSTVAVGAPAPLNATAAGNRAGVVYLFGRQNSTWTRTVALQATTNVPAAGAADAFGADVSINGAGTTVVVGAPSATVSGQAAAGAAYIFALSNGVWNISATLTAATPASDASFGSSVAISTDGNTIAVGQPGAAGAPAGTGKVLVYKQVSSSWTLVATATSLGARGFGNSVALDASATLLIVGAPDTPEGLVAGAGRAEVFALGSSNSQTVAVPVFHIVLPFGSTALGLGDHVAVSGDGKVLAAGAPGGTGALLLFREHTATRGVWARLDEQQPPSGGGAATRFGDSVSLSADGSDVLTGAPGWTPSSSLTSSGTATVRNVASLSSVNITAFAKPFDGAPLALGGTARGDLGLSIATDALGDRIAIGSDVGVYMLQKTNTSVSYLGRFDRPVEAGDEYRVWALEATANMESLFVGSNLLDSTGAATNGSKVSLSGYVDVWRSQANGTLALHQKITNEDLRTQSFRVSGGNQVLSGERLGASVGVSRDGACFAAGAPGFRTATGSQGRVYVYALNTTTDAYVRSAVIESPDPSDRMQFGGVWAGSTAVTTGCGRVATGAYFRTFNGTRSGSVFVYERDATTGAYGNATEVVYPDAQANSWFGYAVALDGEDLYASALRVDDGATPSAGAVYWFRRDSGTGTWTLVRNITASPGSASGEFGSRIVISSNRLRMVVGAKNYAEATNGDDNGAAFVFERTSVTADWVQVTRLQAGAPEDGSEFGTAVAMSLDGGQVYVGASWSDTAGINAGAAYAFDERASLPVTTGPPTTVGPVPTTVATNPPSATNAPGSAATQAPAVATTAPPTSRIEVTIGLSSPTDVSAATLTSIEQEISGRLGIASSRVSARVQARRRRVSESARALLVVGTAIIATVQAESTAQAQTLNTQLQSAVDNGALRTAVEALGLPVANIGTTVVAPTNVGTAAPAGGDGLSTGAVAGIVVAAVIGSVVIIGVIVAVVVVSSRKKKDAFAKEDNFDTLSAGLPKLDWVMEKDARASTDQEGKFTESASGFGTSLPPAVSEYAATDNVTASIVPRPELAFLKEKARAQEARLAAGGGTPGKDGRIQASAAQNKPNDGSATGSGATNQGTATVQGSSAGGSGTTGPSTEAHAQPDA